MRASMRRSVRGEIGSAEGPFDVTWPTSRRLLLEHQPRLSAKILRLESIHVWRMPDCCRRRTETAVARSSAAPRSCRDRTARQEIFRRRSGQAWTRFPWLPELGGRGAGAVGPSAKSVREVAAYLSVDEKTVYRLAKRGASWLQGRGNLALQAGRHRGLDRAAEDRLSFGRGSG